MITVHHLNNSRSQRILWLLEELELDYEIKRYQRDPETMLAPASLMKVHPLGKSPVVTDGSLTLAESGAIIEYLVDTYDEQGRLAPQRDTRDRLRYTYFLHYAEGSAMPPLLLRLVFDRIAEGPVPFFVKPVTRAISARVNNDFIQPQIDRHLDFLEGELSRRRWFAGRSFSAADIQMSFPLEAAASRGVIGDHRPKLTAFLDRIHARPAYQRALERGGEYALGR
ncbi:MAG: glutathione S-transferase [Gammaproteobacteria bacterium]